jgi:hypothetical protein
MMLIKSGGVGIKPKAGEFFKYCLVYPFVIRCLYLMRQAMEPTYMNSTCLLELVRVSAPEHYTIHPLWQHFDKHGNVTCLEVTGLSTEEFFLHNHSGGILEFKVSL